MGHIERDKKNQGGGGGGHVNLVRFILLKCDAIYHAPNIYVNSVTIMEIQAWSIHLCLMWVCLKTLQNRIKTNGNVKYNATAKCVWRSINKW